MRTPKFAVAVLVATLAAGCGNGDETDYYTLTPVTGTVTLDGEPLDGAKVIFTPNGNVPDTPGSDITGKQGNYKIMYRGRSGVAKGKYSVQVSKTLGETAIDDFDGSDSGEFSAERAKAAMMRAAEQTAASVRPGAKKTKPIVVMQTFDREVGDKATVLDFDLKR